MGFQVRGWTPFAATFAAFLSRAYDFIRMAVISQAKLCLNGSHAGVSIGEDGPSQMALEDLAEFRALGGSVVLYPCDPNQTVKLVEAMVGLRRDLLPALDARPRCRPCTGLRRSSPSAARAWSASPTTTRWR